MPEAILNSPLAEVLAQGPRTLQVDGRACVLGERAFDEMFNRRGSPDEPRFVQAVLQHTGLHLPRQANGASLDPQRQLLWLGPGEWLLKLYDRQGDAVLAGLRAELSGLHAAVVDVGHGSTTLTLRELDHLVRVVIKPGSFSIDDDALSRLAASWAE